MNKNTIIFSVLAILVGAAVFFIGYTQVETPKEVYKVYLDGKEIGLIESKEELEDYIDKEQNEIKEKYGVDKVYVPNNLDIEREVTYKKEVNTVEEIYEKIKDIAPFTINGYEVKIKGVEQINADTMETTKTIKLYILDKDIFNEAIETTVHAFIEEDVYKAYKNNSQKEIENTGSIIKDVFIENDVTVKKTNVSVQEKIYTDVDELSKFLLFGKQETQKDYVVKSGDTIEDIAFNNKMSVNEFLVANPSITSEDNLLYQGQVVNIGLIEPAFKLIEENFVVEYQTVDYSVVYEYDKDLPKGVEKVKQQGKDGKAKVSYNLVKANGEIISTETKNVETITAAQNKIVIKGTKVLTGIGVNVGGIWHWPTEKPYTITSRFGYRWGKLHNAIDIAGKYKSKIFASNEGTIVEAGYNSTNGNYVIIDHGNGYYTSYCHMTNYIVKKDDIVEMGQVIGYMGETGFATGVHLHFSLSRGYPFRGSYTWLDPLKSLKFK